MKKLAVSIVFLLLAVLVLFFPITNTYIISGTGEVLTTDKVKIEECSLSVEIKEVSSFLADYRRTFSFVMNDEHVSEFETQSFFEMDDGLCGITQAYYDTVRNQVAFCELLYQKDLSYAALYWKGMLFFLPNGTELTYSEIPWSFYKGT